MAVDVEKGLDAGVPQAGCDDRRVSALLDVHIPNVEMLNKTVTVYTAGDERRSSVEVIVEFGTDLERARNFIRAPLPEVPGVNRLGSIRSRVVASGVELSIRFWHAPGIQTGNDVRDAAIPVILDALADADIGVAPPADIAIVERSARLPLSLVSGTTSRPRFGRHVSAATASRVLWRG